MFWARGAVHDVSQGSSPSNAGPDPWNTIKEKSPGRGVVEAPRWLIPLARVGEIVPLPPIPGWQT